MKTRLLLSTVFFLAVALLGHYLQSYRVETIIRDDFEKEAEEAQRSLQEQKKRLAAERSLRRPVINLLEDSLRPDAPRFIWDNAKEEIISRIAASTAASDAGAVAALEQALSEGRFEAAALLWQLTRDPTLSERLVGFMHLPRHSHLQVSGYFSLGVIQDMKKVPALWKSLREWENEPRLQVAIARAIYKTIQSPQALDELRRIAALNEDGDTEDVSAPELAAAALKDLGFDPPARDEDASPRRRPRAVSHRER